MLREIILKDVSIDEELRRTLVLPGSGKIINIFVEFNEKTSSTIKLRMMTKLGEVVLNINNTNKEQFEVFYPRLNATAGREHLAVMPEEIQTTSEYYYFHGSLFLDVEKDNLEDRGILIKNLIVLYEE